MEPEWSGNTQTERVPYSKCIVGDLRLPHRKYHHIGTGYGDRDLGRGREDERLDDD